MKNKIDSLVLVMGKFPRDKKTITSTARMSASDTSSSRLLTESWRTRAWSTRKATESFLDFVQKAFNTIN